MNRYCALVPRAWTSWHLATMLACGFLMTIVGGAFAAEGSGHVVRVEEDWELAVGEPDAACQAPQVTTIMAPRGSLDGRYFAFDLNHQSLPEFRGGGMQTQVWNFDEPALSQNYPNCDTLQHDSETVTWTQRMSLSDGVLTLDIVNGASSTWGSFGGSDLQISTATGVENLNGYDPAVTVANSGVGFASNRVHWLKLKAVRYYSSAGQVSEDSSSRTVYEHQ
jgi:hypothetical protein